MIQPYDLIQKFKDARADNWGYIRGTAGVLWTAALQEQKVSYMEKKYGSGWKTSPEAKTDSYYYSAKEGSKWIGHRVADCSGLFYWAFKQLGESIYHGSNTIWNRYCSAGGKIVSGRKADGSEIQPGSAVFVYQAAKNNRSHIGLYIGDGVVIEAGGTQTGVITSPIIHRKWAEWGELKNVAYGGGGEEDRPAEDTRPTLRRGSKGAGVTKAQELLLQKGYDLGKWGADGDFGSATEAAVIRFQRDSGLVPDGIIGPATWKALEPATPAAALYSVTIPHLAVSQAEALVKQYAGAAMKEERK